MTQATKPIPGLIPQKDGSYAVILECPNGIVTPEVLAEAARITRETSAIFHVATAQKAWLLGLDESTAAEAVRRLEAAGATIRKTRDLGHPRVCVGKPYCKLAFQDTFALGEHLYKELGRVPIPPKLKVGVSGCPACCSWATMLDLGFMGVRSGWRVLLGGHGGANPVPGQEIGTVATNEEAAEVLRRLAELFTREVAKKSRVDRIIRKAGLDAVKRELGFTDEG